MAEAEDLMRKLDDAISSADEHEIARVISWVRCGAGTMMVMAPRRALRAWTGVADAEAPSAMAVRSLGARDLAIGVGTLFAISHETPVRGWVEAGMMSDAADAVNCLVGMPHVSKVRALFFGLTSAAAALVAYRIASTIDD